MGRKVCHITTVHDNRYDPRIFERECTSLADAGYDVTLIINDKLPNETKNGVKIISLNQTVKNRMDRARRIANLACKKAIEVDAEIYHIHDPELLRIAVKLKKQGKKVIFDSHEFTAMQILTKDYIPKTFRKLISNIYRRYETKTLSQLSGLVYPCTYNGKDYFKNVNLPKAMIGNYPSLKVLNQITQDTDIIIREKKVCYLGGITISRGGYHMVRAAAIAGVPLVLIGEIPAELRAELEKMPEFANVECLGKLPHDRALKELSKCMVGLSILQDEGQYAKLDNLPTKLYEYMALGIPAVFSNFPYYKKCAEEYSFGIAVKPDDDEMIAKAITQILSDEQNYQSMIKEGKRAIAEKMNWEKDSEKLLSLYQTLLC